MKNREESKKYYLKIIKDCPSYLYLLQNLYKNDTDDKNKGINAVVIPKCIGVTEEAATIINLWGLLNKSVLSPRERFRKLEILNARKGNRKKSSKLCGK